jgi:PIN domain nuclease of toxin-antitoxin system
MYLVDTHVLLWLTAADARLGPVTREALATATAVRFSAISVLELTITAMNGRLRAPERLEERLTAQGLRALPFTGQHAEAIHAFPALARHDPFDRALLAQAQVERLRFLTVDQRLLDLRLDWVEDASA